MRIAAQHLRSVPKTPHETSAKVACKTCKTATLPYCSMIQGEKYRKVIAPLQSASPEATPLEPALHSEVHWEARREVPQRKQICLRNFRSCFRFLMTCARCPTFVAGFWWFHVEQKSGLPPSALHAFSCGHLLRMVPMFIYRRRRLNHDTWHQMNQCQLCILKILL